MLSPLWNSCVQQLENDLPEQQWFNTWIRPLQAIEKNGVLQLLAPNRFVVDWVNTHFIERIREILRQSQPDACPQVMLGVGSRSQTIPAEKPGSAGGRPAPQRPMIPTLGSRLNGDYTFETFVEGKSNQLAKAAAIQVAANVGRAYNPLLIYGGVGLGKTHLMHAIGNAVIAANPSARVAYVHSERFVGDMVKALQHNRINQFKRAYRSLNTLLIDDIQFFAGKERSQ
ncbi:MAG: ATP-binding protein, partial [Proteobacteria bacterium]|nr:ATP-binding protein [Pseudomonadota bacterium]